MSHRKSEEPTRRVAQDRWDDDKIRRLAEEGDEIRRELERRLAPMRTLTADNLKIRSR